MLKIELIYTQLSNFNSAFSQGFTYFTYAAEYLMLCYVLYVQLFFFFFFLFLKLIYLLDNYISTWHKSPNT